MQNKKYKFLRIILNKLYDTPIKKLHATANIPTIQEYIQNSFTTAYHLNHHNPLSNTRKYVTNLPLKIKTRLPKHVITQIINQLHTRSISQTSTTDFLKIFSCNHHQHTRNAHNTSQLLINLNYHVKCRL